MAPTRVSRKLWKAPTPATRSTPRGLRPRAPRCGQNGTDRSYNARKVRRTYQFSKDLLVHVAVGWWVMFCYNFHHLHRGLRLRLADGTFMHRTPAMVMGLEDRPLAVADILTTQLVGFTPPPVFIPAQQRLLYIEGHAP